MDSEKDLVRALRCSASVKTKDLDCRNCKYRTLDEIDERIPCPPDVEENGKKYWESCNCDQIVLDAADLIEELLAEGD